VSILRLLREPGSVPAIHRKTAGTVGFSRSMPTSTARSVRSTSQSISSSAKVRFGSSLASLDVRSSSVP
jgi:hypothetical protein